MSDILSSRIFIVGVGRSGTSLLHSMLSSHSEVYGTKENGALRKYFSRLKLNAIEQSESIIVNENQKKFSRSNVNDSSIHSYINLFKTNKSFILDKDPRLVEYIDLIKLFFPLSFIIHIYRDPRDVLASKRKAAWSRGRSLISYLVASRVQLECAFSSQNVLHVKYEDLITEPHSILKLICEYIGLKFEVNMLEYYKSSNELIADREIEWKGNLTKSVLSNNYGNWKNSLTPIQASSALLVTQKFSKMKEYTHEGMFSAWVTISSKFIFVIVSVITFFYLKKENFKRKFLFR